MNGIDAVFLTVMLCPSYLLFRFAFIIEKVNPKLPSAGLMIPAWFGICQTLRAILKKQQIDDVELYLLILLVFFYFLTGVYETLRLKKLKQKGSKLKSDTDLKLRVMHFLTVDVLIVFFVFITGMYILMRIKG